MSTKIVLIQLPSPWLISDRDLPLLGVLYLAATLREAGVEVQVADLVGQSPDRWYIPEGDVYGISLVTAHVPLAKECVRQLRERTSHKITVVVGGPHVSALPEWSLRYLDADFAFKGEADHTLTKFMQGEDPSKLEGCYFWVGGRQTGTIMGNAKLPKVDPGSVPLPARDLVDSRSFHRVGINRYVTEHVKYEGYLQTGRGCPFDCAFCAQASITGRIARYTPIPKVLEDLENLLGKYECDLIYIEDDTFNIHKKRVLEICKEFERYKFKWHCLCRADTMEDALAEAMVKAGCQNVTFGFESGSDDMLLKMDKEETMAEAWKAIKCVKKHGLGIRGQMIVGFPGETQETIEQTADFLRSAPVDKWGFHMFSLLPGTQAWRKSVAAGEIIMDEHTFDQGFETIGKPGEWSRRSYEHPQAREWLDYLRGIADKRNIYEYGKDEEEVTSSKGWSLNRPAWEGV